jgi:hypothetical protein
MSDEWFFIALAAILVAIWSRNCEEREPKPCRWLYQGICYWPGTAETRNGNT